MYFAFAILASPIACLAANTQAATKRGVEYGAVGLFLLFAASAIAVIGAKVYRTKKTKEEAVQNGFILSSEYQGNKAGESQNAIRPSALGYFWVRDQISGDIIALSDNSLAQTSDTSTDGVAEFISAVSSKTTENDDNETGEYRISPNRPPGLPRKVFW